eukprot:Selendium_serpulae@DN6148_c0_g6_i1.p1
MNDQSSSLSDVESVLPDWSARVNPTSEAAAAVTFWESRQRSRTVATHLSPVVEKWAQKKWVRSSFVGDTTCTGSDGPGHGEQVHRRKCPLGSCIDEHSW